MTAIRNFVITFFLSLLVFGVIGYALFGIGASAFSSGGVGGSSGPDATDPSQTDDPYIGNNVTVGVNGESFSLLLAITDYLPDVYDDYEVSENDLDENGFPREPREIETDTLLLLRFDKEKGQCLFSIIPDITQIKIGGLSAHLKDLYAQAGPEALADKVSTLTGLTVDYYAVTSYDNFAAFVDYFGGVPFYVPEDMHQVDEENGLNINLRRGSQTIDGEKTISLLRYELYDDGESAKRKCQTDFMMALIKQIFSKIELRDAAVTYVANSSLFETNFTLEAMTANAELIFSYSQMSVKSYTYPGTAVGSGEEAYITPNTVAAREFFSQYKFKG